VQKGCCRSVRILDAVKEEKRRCDILYGGGGEKGDYEGRRKKEEDESIPWTEGILLPTRREDRAGLDGQKGRRIEKRGGRAESIPLVQAESTESCKKNKNNNNSAKERKKPPALRRRKWGGGEPRAL